LTLWNGISRGSSSNFASFFQQFRELLRELQVVQSFGSGSSESTRRPAEFKIKHRQERPQKSQHVSEVGLVGTAIRGIATCRSDEQSELHLGFKEAI
jgi:hypothetical protein